MELNEGLERRVIERTEEILLGETRLRTILDNIGEGIVTIDDKGYIESINPIGKKIFSLQNELVEGMDSRDLVIFSSSDNKENILLRMEADKPIELTGYKINGKDFPIEVVVTDMKFNELTKRVCIMRDITQRKEAQEKLEAAQKQIVKAAHTSGMAEIATGVLHNIGNILNSVNLSSEELQRYISSLNIDNLIKANEMLSNHEEDIAQFFSEDPKGKKLPEYYIKFGNLLNSSFTKMKEEVELLSQKVNMMRDVIQTQQTYARSSFQIEEFEIHTIIDDALKVQESSLLRNEVSVNKRIPQDLPLCKGQRSKLLQVVTNLIKNASEAMRENDAAGKNKQLVIEVGADDKNMDVRIIDNGVGILKEHIEQVFNHGFTTKLDGHGFGLHASANAMTEMQGRLIVESQGQGLGAIFIVQVPVVFLNTELPINVDVCAKTVKTAS